MRKKCKGLTFLDCQLTILRSAVDDAEKIQGQKKLQEPEIKNMIHILEEFLKKNKLLVYGGTALNNILPKEDQFYDKSYELPDYDFYSKNPIETSIELSDLYYKNGFKEVEAKSGQHHGTYKVYVNFMPIADITFMNEELFDSLKKHAIVIDKIYYCPPNFLRMGIYKELSRPSGDVSRWEKVFKRLVKFSKYYPIKASNCKKINYRKKIFSNIDDEIQRKEDKIKMKEIYQIIKTTLFKEDVLFFGGYAITLYSKYYNNQSELNFKLKNLPYYDVISEDPEKTANNIKNNLNTLHIDNVVIDKKENIGEIIPFHYDVKVNGESIVFIYKSQACYGYNIIKIDGYNIKIASIDTILSFYLAFIYIDRNYYDSERLLCIANYLFQIQQHNQLQQKELLKRFVTSCYGHEKTIEEIKEEKAKKFEELKGKKQSKDYKEWFFKYNPDMKKQNNRQTRKKTIKSKPSISKKKTINKTKKIN